ncbi:MAG: aminotransferase class I/II-fold pyridoxal phosphate-dependent enzyme [Thermodesulfobacteriota bacterium]|nr:aminotransferase class I/II-fold pyridoxal phosphate-dependent enzyme [Thermodesulfobacteriota bacterium]
MNPIAKELNDILQANSPHIFDMLSDVGKSLFFPKGILSQSAEAKEKAHAINATIGIAKEEGGIMCLPSVMDQVAPLVPEESLTYAPSFGIPGLRKAWQKGLYEKNPSLADQAVSLPVVTCGITHAISVFADVWTNPGDTVLLPHMFWGNYNMILNVRRGVNLSHFPLFNEAGGFNVKGFEKAARAAAEKDGKLITLLNFPQNPTGYTLTHAEGEAMTAVLTDIAAGGADVMVVCDDSYFGLFYEENVMKESLFARLCGAHERLLAIKLDGATKENYVWGLRIGFVTYGCKAGASADVYDALEKKTAGCVRGSISNASHLGQSIVLKSLENANYQKERQAKGQVLKARANKVKQVLADPGYGDAWEVYPFNSGYFMCLKLKKVKAEALRVHLLDKYGVGLIALGEHDLRVAFSCIEEADVQRLFDIIYKGAKELQ